MAFQVGETVGRYRIIEQLGQGGMATVFKAYHAELDRYVALKVLHPAFLEESSFLTRFQREARLVAKMDHPNIVPIYDYAEHEGRPYLVMKFIEGETLKARLSRSAITSDEIRLIVESVGAALAYAHKQGILHRDMKPSNVLLANDGQIYLADFGLARIAQSGESTLTSDMILGTPQYISPEQALGKKDLDEGTDIYSFGVMLYELAVGKVPFSADTPFSIIHDHIYSPLPLPRIVNPSVSEDLERVLLKALAKERVDRYKDVKSLVTAFNRALEIEVPLPIPHQRGKPVKVDPDAQTLVPAAQVAPLVPDGSNLQPSEELEAGNIPKKRKKIPWMWLAVVVILLLGCLFIIATFRSARPFRFTPPSVGSVETEFLSPTPKSVSEIDRARNFVEENENDPGAHMQLALAYHRAGMVDLAQDSITDVERIAALDEGFLWDAVRIAAEADAWLSAACLAVDAAELHLESAPILPEDLVTLLHEAVYKAMKDKMADKYSLIERLNGMDEPLAKLAKARYTFFFGEKVQAQNTLDELFQMKPGFPEAQLLQADFSSRVGDPERSRQALSDLRSNPGVKDWMLVEAQIIEGNLP